MASEKATYLERCCPHCGFKLSFEQKDKTIECPKCANTVTIEMAEKVTESKEIVVNDNSSSLAIISGADKNPESILIFLEDYFEVDKREEYEEFSLVGTRNVNRLIEELKLTHGNEMLTWKAVFYSIVKPALIRFDLLDDAKNEIANAISDENEEETIRLFENFQLASEELSGTKEKAYQGIDRCLKRIEKMGAKEDEINELKGQYEQLQSKFASIENKPERIEDIPELAKAKEAMDLKIEERFINDGIDAKELYSDALRYEEEGNYERALVYFVKLGDYKDSRQRAAKYNKCVVFKDLLVVNNHYYAFKEHEREVANNKREEKMMRKEEEKNERHSDNYDIVATKLNDDGVNEASDEVLINNYQCWLNAFGDNFYYISKRGTIHAYNLVKKEDKELENVGRHLENVLKTTYDNGTKRLLVSRMKFEKKDDKELKKIGKKKEKTSDDLEPDRYNKLRIDILNYGRNDFFFEPLIDHIDDVVKFSNGKFIMDNFIKVIRYSFEERKVSRKVKKVYKIKHVILVNIRTKEQLVDLVDLNENIVYIQKNNVYFTRFAPTKYNLSLIKLDLETKEETVLLENVYSIAKIINEKVFYIVGNTEKRDFYYFNIDSGVKNLVMERYNGFEHYDSGYFYLYRGRKYNRTLVKVKEDGSETIYLAYNIAGDEVPDYCEKNGGYFYYQNIYDELCSVRIDGEKHNVIAQDIDEVLRANDKEIIYSIWETTDKMFGKSKRDKYRYRRAYSIYRYDVKKEISEKLLFGLDYWEYYKSDDTLYYTRINEETYKPTNVKSKFVFDYDTIQTDYYETKISEINEKKVLCYGLPHMEKHSGCFLIRLFTRKKDHRIKFERQPWKRPYLNDKEEEL